jgi:hypothetical protein
MNKPAISNFAITLALLALVAFSWVLQTYGQSRPEALPLAAPAQSFSAARAEQALARILGPEKPHPVSTAENARVRGRIVQELQRLGLHPVIHQSFACHPPHAGGLLICATVNDVMADVRPGPGKAIILLAHYDSVPAGPGAADDESGVAAVVETARAIIARGGAVKHPIVALLTDGEEADLLGAAAFLRDPALKARVGAVINVEARGNRGPSFLFQTSPGDGPLIDLYAANTSDYATSSLYNEIYRFLPNDTDLTLFIRAGFPSFNFAYVGGLFDYHTANDTRANLDPVSLQQHGENMLGVASGLEQADFAGLRGHNDIYLDILGRWLPRAPASWAVPLAIIALLMLLAAAFLARPRPFSWWRWLLAFAATPVLLFVAIGAGFLLHGVAALVSGARDPSYAYPTALRIALALELAGAALLVSRLASSAAAAATGWIWIGLLGLGVAIYLPGFSPYFLIPTLVAAVLLLPATRAQEKLEGRFGVFALLLAALAAILIWSSIGAEGETIMGLKLHPMFTAPFAIALSAIVPLLARYPLPRGIWAASVGICFLGAIGAAIVQGLTPTYSTIAAQRLNITYLQNRERAFWTVDETGPVPESMRAVAAFSAKPLAILPAFPAAHVAPAGDPRFPLPNATIIARPTANGVRQVTLLFHGSDAADQMILIVPKAARLKAVDLPGWHFAAPPEWAHEDYVALACMSRDCRSQSVTLTLAADAALTLGLCEHRFGLPGFGWKLIRARPGTAVPSQNGDGVTLASEIRIPAT